MKKIELGRLASKFCFLLSKAAELITYSYILYRNTARTFYAAGTFLDILKQFGEPSEDVLEKTRYSKWKAADILKALKEGRTPAPGAPGENLVRVLSICIE